MRGNYILSVGIGVLSLFCFLYSCNHQKKEDMDSEVFMYIGTYTAKDSEGIYAYKLDTKTGDTEFVSSTKMDNPSYLATSPNGKILFAASENNDRDRDAIQSYQIDPTTGKLTLLDSVLVEGVAPCNLMNTPNGDWIATANYTSGSVSLVRVNDFGMFDDEVHVLQFEGSGPNQERQKQSHLHAVYASPDSLYLFANDLGGDKIYRFDNMNDLANSSVSEIDVKPGSGPRHTAFHPNGKWAYTITELSGEVIAFNYTDGVLEEFQTIEADSLGAGGSADIQITPNGKYLYASNRLKGDGIALFSINQTSGQLEKIGYQATGIHPRNMAITPNGRFLLVACRDTDTVELYRIDSKTGLLKNINKDIQVSMPVFIRLVQK